MKNLKSIIIAFFAISFLFASCEKERSSFNDLISFSFENVDFTGSIDGSVVYIYVPLATDYTKLIPIAEISEGAYSSLEFGNVYDFTEDVVFTILAENGEDEEEYTIKVFVETFTDFEELTLTESGFWNGSDLSGEYVSGNLTFKNVFTDLGDGFTSWNGFAYSNLVDEITEGYGNQYSSCAGSGALSSEKFGISSISGKSEIVFTIPTTVEEIYLTNATYAALSMRNGDTFAKKFGGDDGTEPDWFMLSIEGSDENGLVTDTLEVYLADYRFDNNSEDFIVKDWLAADLTALGEVKQLSFWLTSSDNGDVGMNTPAYFCIDNLLGTVQK